jgi:hypothetical protein
MVLFIGLISLNSRSVVSKSGVLIVLFFGQRIVRALGRSVPRDLSYVRYQSWAHHRLDRSAV